MNETEKHLKEIEKLIVKIKNKMKRSDLDYTVQFSMSSIEPGKAKYSLQISPPEDNLEPVTFIKNSYEDLRTAASIGSQALDADKVKKSYHLAKAADFRKAAKYHEDKAENYDKKEDSEENSKV